MCGIAVHFNPHGPAQPLDLQVLRHRGPDACGEWLSEDGKCWLGNTRLAIIDLSSAGSQPMTDPSTWNVIVMNGEIYNHLVLRQRLGLAVTWNGTSDTETLLKGYAQWGRDVVRHLKGMFAFAIYDAKAKELFFARDRFGMKPLYYVLNSNGLSAASEVRGLPVGDLGRITARSLSGYLQWGACPEDNLLYSHLRLLPAGHAMTIGPNGEMKTWKYWPTSKTFVSPSADVPQRVRALIDKSVEEHLLADVPVGTFLSGGIDSSIITAIAARKRNKKLQTFSVGFDQVAFDETNVAQKVATRHQTEHQRIQLSGGETLHLVTEAVEKLDLPSVDAINTYIVSRAVAASKIKVALSGLGGDELFGGYPSFRDVNRLRLIGRLPRGIRSLVGELGGFGDRLADLPNTRNAGELAIWRRRFFTDRLISRARLPVLPSACKSEVGLLDDFAQISWAELTGYMRRMLLRDADQMSMAVSLEVRMPFLDHQLVEYVLGLPESVKRQYPGPKGLLVEACRDLLPPAVYQRQKTGFVLPMKIWMLGPLAAYVEEGLRETVERGFFPASWVRPIKLGFQRGRLHWTRLWSIAVLGQFAKRKQLLRSPDEDTAIDSLS
jgi:asparagine synthase (glutamine-hydrolysing)